MPGPTSSGGFKQVSAAASKGMPAPMLKPGATRKSGVDRLFARPSFYDGLAKSRLLPISFQCRAISRRAGGVLRSSGNVFEAAGDRWIGRTRFIYFGLKIRMLPFRKPSFPSWPSARSYEIGLLSFSAAQAKCTRPPAGQTSVSDFLRGHHFIIPHATGVSPLCMKLAGAN